MSVETLAETLLDKLRWIAQAETVIGKPVQSGEVTIIPVSRVSLGFGLGGHQGRGEMSGSGGGVQVDPVAFLVIQGSEVRVLPVHKDSTLVQKVYELVPDILSGLMNKKNPG